MLCGLPSPLISPDFLCLVFLPPRLSVLTVHLRMMDLVRDFYANNNLHSVASLPPSPHSPAGLAWPLVGDLDKSVVEGQIVTD